MCFAKFERVLNPANKIAALICSGFIYLTTAKSFTPFANILATDRGRVNQYIGGH